MSDVGGGVDCGGGGGVGVVGRSVFGGVGAARGIDDIRYTSGKQVQRNDMSITLEQVLLTQID